jgi:uncharacterized protein (TIGR03083 family)
MHLPFDATEHLRTDGSELLDAAQRTGLDAPVRSCPGWTMADLVWHIGEVWSFWSLVVEKRLTSREALEAEPDFLRPRDDLLVDWASAAHTGVLAALNSTPPRTEVWTWTGANRDVWWVRRRMAHETTIHRWDAEHTVGDDYDIPIAVAADGIDEYLSWFAPKNRGASVGGTIHIHCTDTDRRLATGSDDISAVHGEWMIHRLDERGIDVEHGHAKGDVAIRGRAQDILLWLWGREGGPVEFLGDEAIARRLVSGADLD